MLTTARRRRAAASRGAARLLAGTRRAGSEPGLWPVSDR